MNPLMTIALFGVLTVVGFFVAGFFLWKRAREERYAEADVFDVFLTASVWVLVVSRAVAIAVKFDQFGFDPLRWLSIVTLPGFNGLAALCTAIVMILLAAAKRRWDAWVTLDVFLPSVLVWEASVVVLSNWIVALFWVLWFGFLWWIEREYRLWSWYKGRRSSARPGLVAGAWFIGNGLGFPVLAGFPSTVVFFPLVTGACFVAIGIAMIIGRSNVIHMRRNPRRSP